MSQTPRPRATAEQVKQEALRHLFHELGSSLRLGAPAYNERHHHWTFSIQSRELSPDVALGHIVLDEYGTIITAPTLLALERAARRFERTGFLRPVVIAFKHLPQQLRTVYPTRSS